MIFADFRRSKTGDLGKFLVKLGPAIHSKAQLTFEGCGFS